MPNKNEEMKMDMDTTKSVTTGCVDCENYKLQLKQAEDTIKQYEQAYQELQTKFNKLYNLYLNNLDFELGIKRQ